jgi:catecholate siderophore receptor
MTNKNIEIKTTSKKTPQMSTLAFALCASLLATQASADEKKTESTTLEKVSVEESVSRETNPYAVPGSPYLAERLSDPRRTRKLAETPQTITVLTAEAIEESGKTDLKEILDGQPGITLGTGENGNAFGDRYVIRGHEARSDMFVDGLRDPGMTMRESFAVDQIEISKGPSSSFAGRGTTGGAVNSSTKRASTESDFGEISTAIGTDNHHRITLDYNKVINDDTAIRANILHAKEDVPDRDPADRQREGLALSLTHQATDNLEFTVDYYHFKGDDNPDLGTYLTDSDNDGYTNNPAKDVPAYLQDEDFLSTQVDTITLRTGLEIDDSSRIVNLTRFGKTDNGYFVSGARGTTGYATEADALAGTNGFDTFTLSNHQGWQEVEYFANQLNYMKELEIADMKHEFVLGAEYQRQTVLNGVYSATSNGATNCYAAGRGGVSSSYCGRDSSGNIVSNLNNLLQRDITKSDWDSDWSLNTISLYLMDTVDLTDDWTAFGGVRYEYYDYNLKTQGRSDAQYDYNKGDWNGHVGVSYKINPSANVYASFSTATNLNGGESDVGTSGGYGGYVDTGDTASAEPETTNSYELGTKWRFNNDKLLATAAVFRIDKTDVMETVSGGDYSATGTANTGGNRVDGIEFGLSGYLTDKLSVQGGITFMKSKITKSSNSDNVGKKLANFADSSINVQARYHLTPAFTLGGAVNYENKKYTGQPDSAASETMYVPAYTTVDAFATYKINSKASLRLNVNNLFNKDYYLAAYRSGSFTYIGDKRNAQLTLNYKF